MRSFTSSGWTLLLLLLAWCGVVTPQAAARRRSDGTAGQARELLNLREAGLAALAHKDLAAADRAFTEYYRRTLKPEGLYHLGMLADAEGRLLEAQDLLRRFLSTPGSIPEASAMAEQEVQRILALPRPPSGKLNVIGEQGSLVLLDGRILGALPLSRPLLVAPGKHTLVIEEGQYRQQEELDVLVGRYLEVTYDRLSSALLSVELPGALVLEQFSGLPKDAEASLRQAIEDTLQGARLSPFPLSMALAELDGSNASSCFETTACQLKLARRSKLDYVLSIALTQPAPNTSWQLRLDLLDVEIGEQAAHSEESCAQCDVAWSVAAIKKALPLLVAEARRRPRGELEVKSTPAGAEVRLAGRALGTTPLLQPAWTGSFDVEVALAGHAPQRLPVVVSPSEKATLNVTLSPKVAPPPPVLPEVPPPPPRRPAWRLGLGGGALGAGTLLLGVGVAALAIDERCVDSPPDPLAFCDKVYSTRGIGAGLTAVGGGLMLSGVVLLALPPRRSPARPTPTSVPLNR